MISQYKHETQNSTNIFFILSVQTNTSGGYLNINHYQLRQVLNTQEFTFLFTLSVDPVSYLTSRITTKST